MVTFTSLLFVSRKSLWTADILPHSRQIRNRFSLRLALYYLRHHLTQRDVCVSIDGAHIKTGNTVHFDIRGFLREQRCVKVDGGLRRWQGIYRGEEFAPSLLVDSLPGSGDVQIALPDGKTLYVESKKSRPGPPSQEYSLMREAIGQLMTGCPMDETILPAVAVPRTKKSLELAQRWSALAQIQKVGIRFLLVGEDGSISMF